MKDPGLEAEIRIKKALASKSPTKWFFAFLDADGIFWRERTALIDKIVALGDPKWCYRILSYIADRISSRERKRLIREIIDGGKPEWCYYILCKFGRGMDGVSCAGLLERIRISGQVKWCFWALRWLKTKRRGWRIPKEEKIEKELVEKIVAARSLWWKYYTLIDFHNILPEDKKKKLIRRIISAKDSACCYYLLYQEFSDRRETIGIPERQIRKLIEATHSLWVGESRVQKVIEMFFGNNYIVADSDPRGLHFSEVPYIVFARLNQIPVFIGNGWEILDFQKKKGAAGQKKMESLIQNKMGREFVNVLLLRDHQGSYAYQVSLEAETVREALAYFFRLDPKRFQGFAIEV